MSQTSVARPRASSPPVAAPPVELRLTPDVDLTVSAAGFAELCRLNSDLRLELSASGTLIAMAPAGSDTGHANAGITARLFIWNETARLGYVFDSSAGFTLPNGAIRAPDASWIERSRYDALTPDQRKAFAHICPDFVIELRSPSDSQPKVRDKMVEYLAQGARLGWLIDPISVTAEIYRPGRDPQILERPASLDGEDVLPGFRLDLTGILT
ncbi:Uma2 family endonuclease [Isosphaeraceae bacterium EP7]